ncbi:MAG: dephospho-CoA kinase [Elusimicrobiota bacterium]|jgi:dephospho-CoA kinase|nr:dephospho-CoA kinase [Elusimicrobiota bacterium]
MILGLTGSIGSGKTQAAKFFKEFGAYTIDADKISRKLTAKGQDSLKEIVKIFGKDILTSKGSLNRKKLGKIVFKDIKAKKALENILHDKIISEIRLISSRQCQKSDIIIDAPLLFETGLNKICDKTIVIWTPLSEQIKRLSKRSKLSEKEIENRINSQMPADKKMQKAGFIIDNSADKPALKQNIKSLYEQIKQE